MKKLKAVYCFKLAEGPGGISGTWYVDVKNGNGAVYFGEKGQCTICSKIFIPFNRSLLYD